MSANRARLTWTLCTPVPARGAIGAMQLRGSACDLDDLLASLGAGRLPLGQVGVRKVAQIDTCVLARFDDESVFVFPHAGKRILELLTAELDRRGIRRGEHTAPRELFPEASDDVEAQMLAALAAAASPLAIDLLLDQPRRWRQSEQIGEVDPAAAVALARLIRPPLVVAIGPPNVGKSSLLNALAGRNLSIVADLPGTTRDHVGATLDLGGLVVRWIDCPGFERVPVDALQAESQRLALDIAAAADLVVVCSDGRSQSPKMGNLIPTSVVLEIALRADLGLPLGWQGQGPVVSVRGQAGLPELIQAIRERLVPAAALKDERAWRFWDVPIGHSQSM